MKAEKCDQSSPHPTGTSRDAPDALHRTFSQPWGSSIERLVVQTADLAQGMNGRDAVLCEDVHNWVQVRSCWQRIDSKLIRHYPAAGWLFKSVR